MRLDKFVEGLNILRQYYLTEEEYVVIPEHDEVVMAATDNHISEEDLKKLDELGWCQEGCDEYDPDYDWVAYF